MRGFYLLRTVQCQTYEWYSCAESLPPSFHSPSESEATRSEPIELTALSLDASKRSPLCWWDDPAVKLVCKWLLRIEAVPGRCELLGPPMPDALVPFWSNIRIVYIPVDISFFFGISADSSSCTNFFLSSSTIIPSRVEIDNIVVLCKVGVRWARSEWLIKIPLWRSKNSNFSHSSQRMEYLRLLFTIIVQFASIAAPQARLTLSLSPMMMKKSSFEFLSSEAEQSRRIYEAFSLSHLLFDSLIKSKFSLFIFFFFMYVCPLSSSTHNTSP